MSKERDEAARMVTQKTPMPKFDEPILPESLPLGKPWNRSSAFDAETVARLNSAMEAQARELAEGFAKFYQEQLVDFSERLITRTKEKIDALVGKEL
jgi:hypothetical protein